MPRTEIMKLTARSFSFNFHFLKTPECSKAANASDILVAAVGGLRGDIQGMVSLVSQQNHNFLELKKSLRGELDLFRSEQKRARDAILDEQEAIRQRQDDFQDDVWEKRRRLQDDVQRQRDDLVELQEWAKQQKDQKKTHEEAVSSKDRPAKTGRTPPEKRVVLKPKEKKAERKPDKKPEKTPEKKPERQPEKKPKRKPGSKPKPEKEPEKNTSSSSTARRGQ